MGFDLGSSSVKVSIVDSETGGLIGSASSPEQEMEIISRQQGWAEQDPEIWWEHIIKATRKVLRSTGINGHDVGAIGISYQMHGLVAVDKDQKVLRNSIIWCDSRAVEIGNNAFTAIGPELCLERFLNSPGNFTASKLKWVKENEPELYSRIYKIMLPGDFIGMKLTGEICTTVSGLSEGIFWDYKDQGIAKTLLDYYDISADMLPEYHPSFGIHGFVSDSAANELGLKTGTRVSYRAGDQPNNALSLNVLNPGDVATTAGTSGVIYGITDKPEYDSKSRVNTFVHVNNTDTTARFGILLCINGTGILNSWLRKNLGVKSTLDYTELNEIASASPIGAEGLSILPFGNGAERILENRTNGAEIFGLDFNRHNTAHVLRAAQEGIVFSLIYGFQIMKDMGMKVHTVKAGNANMFLSPIFREAFVNTAGVPLELYNTDGAQGAARGAGIGAGVFANTAEAFSGLKCINLIEPEKSKSGVYLDAYEQWVARLSRSYTI